MMSLFSLFSSPLSPCFARSLLLPLPTFPRSRFRFPNDEEKKKAMVLIHITNPRAGATPNPHRRRQTLPHQTRRIAGDRTEGVGDGDEGLRFARRARPRVYLLAAALDRPRGSEGTSLSAYTSWIVG